MTKLVFFLGVTIVIGAIGLHLSPSLTGKKWLQFFAAAAPTNLPVAGVEGAEDAVINPVGLAVEQGGLACPAGISSVAAAETQPAPGSVAAAKVELLTIEKKQSCQSPQYVDVYDEDGTGKTAYYCADVSPQHPYERYPTATLEAMAYSDAKAAEILGMRFRESDPDQSFEWMVRASALGKGDYLPILFLVNTRYSGLRTDNKVLYEIALRRYVLANVIQQLGGPSSPLKSTALLLKSEGASPEALATLDRAAEQIMKKISDIAYEVKGETIIQGARQ